MAVPKKRHSKQKTKHRRFTWAKGAFQKGEQALSASVKSRRKIRYDEPVQGFGKSSDEAETDTEAQTK